MQVLLVGKYVLHSCDIVHCDRYQVEPVTTVSEEEVEEEEDDNDGEAVGTSKTKVRTQSTDSAKMQSSDQEAKSSLVESPSKLPVASEYTLASLLLQSLARILIAYYQLLLKLHN